MNTPNARAEQIFAAALTVADTAERAALVLRECAGDHALRAEVESLLAAHDQADAFMQTERFGGPTALSAADGTRLSSSAADTDAIRRAADERVPAPTEKSGERIGRYKLLEQIGEGGFGAVWMAEQEEPVRRRVALKIIKLGMDTREVVARFEAERQALALMDHPSIARVFDGGATENGRPYFVMELVRGLSITKYCDEHRLTTSERLELFMQVCQAVQHAHQKGVIHRDLKPSNILVMELDGKAVPKVIDFGIARATAQRLTEKTLFTRFGQMVGTPAYMSPEQAGLGGLDIDTRSDVYSLGVILYELLTGRTPFDTKKLLESGFEAILKTIREVEPPKPSTRLSTLSAEELKTVAHKRRAEPAKLNRLVRGELDWIVLKALEKDRNRRYLSAQALADDLNRYLRNEPVEASPPSMVYRLRKIVRARRVEMKFAAVLIVVVVATMAIFRRGPDTPSNPAASWQLPAALAALPAAEALKIAYASRPPAASAPVTLPKLQFEILAKRKAAASFGLLADGDALASEADDYLIVARPLTAGYLYVFQVDSSGKIEWLFPVNENSKFSSGTNPVTAGKALQIPAAGTDRVLFLDKTRGIEHVYAVFSAARWPELETALANPTPLSSRTPSDTLALTIQEPNGLRTRGVGGTRIDTTAADAAEELALMLGGKTYPLPFSNQVLESSSTFLVVERWFRHVNQ